MRSTRSARFTSTIQAEQGACVVRHSGRECITLTRRQLVMGSLATMGTANLAHATSVIVGHVRVVVSNTADYRRGLAHAASRYKAALVDIGADWCEFCATIDQKILPDPEVRRALEHVALVRVDVTQTSQTTQELLRHLHSDGPPTVFIVNTANGREYPGTRSVGSFTATDLLRRLHPFASA